MQVTDNRTGKSRMAILTVVVAATWIASGCGSSLPATVEGVVTLDNQPFPNDGEVTGNVMFYPVGGGAAAFGDVTSGGKYKVTTGGTTGLQPGDYVVTVRIIRIAPPPPGGYEAAPPQQLLSPAKYSDRSQSDLRASVHEGKNTIDLQLLSDQ